MLYPEINREKVIQTINAVEKISDSDEIAATVYLAAALRAMVKSAPYAIEVIKLIEHAISEPDQAGPVSRLSPDYFSNGGVH